MEKYAEIMKGLEMCAGPECCKNGCPYYDMTTVGMTCRARLLLDANVALNNERALRESAEEGLKNAVEELGKLHADVDDLEAVTNTLRAERDGLRLELESANEMRRSVEAHRDAIESDRADITRERDNLRQSIVVLAKERDALRIERDALRAKMATTSQDKTDRPSVCEHGLAEEVGKLVAHANYQQGRADALAAIVERCSFGGGCRHE